MAEIEAQLKAKEDRLVNANVIRALFTAFGDQAQALDQIFFGRADVLDAEHQKLQIATILNLICKIDDVVNKAAVSAGYPVSRFGGTHVVEGGYGDQHVSGPDLQASGRHAIEMDPSTNVTVRSGGGGTSVSGTKFHVQGEGTSHGHHVRKVFNFACPNCGVKVGTKQLMVIGGPAPTALTCSHCGALISM